VSSVSKISTNFILTNETLSSIEDFMHLTCYMGHKYGNRLPTLCTDHVPKKYSDSQNHSRQDLSLTGSQDLGELAPNTHQNVN
jgi:hypothetical protein